MTNHFRTFCLVLIAGFLTVAALASSAMAQTYPNRVIRLVVPFPAGSSVDVIGRLIAEEMTAALGQQVIIENRAGAGGNIAAEYVVGQPADGYTLFLGTTGNMATNKVLYRRLRFDPEVDLAPVSLLYASCNVLILSKNNPVKTLAELIDEAKRSPGKLTFGSPGVGTAGHLVGELFKVRTQTNLAHVPYRGQPQVMNDLMGGHLSMSFEAVGGAIPIILNGSVRGLATTCRERTKQLPDIPTFAELGISDFTLEALAMLAVNSKTPPEIVQQLHDVTVKIVTMPKITDRINNMGVLGRTEVLARYRHLREISKQHHSAALDFLSKDGIISQARRLGLTQGKMLILDSMDDLNLAFDLAIHTAPKDRTRAIDRYARSAGLSPESDEGLVLDAMRHARFAIIGVLRRHDVAGLVVEDFFRGGEVWLVDEGLESSLPEGAALATRLCAPEDFAMTAGVLVPIDIELIEYAIADTPQLLRNRREELIDDRRFAEAIYRVALASGVMEQVAYQDTTSRTE